jgi:hypothetical protein
MLKENVTAMIKVTEIGGIRNVIDYEKSFFTITSGTCKEPDCKPMIIPSDAIEYSLMEFIKLQKTYPYFSRLTNAIKLGLKKNGVADVWCIDGNEYYSFSMVYNEKEKHLVCFNHFKGDGLKPSVNSMDMSKLP